MTVQLNTTNKRPLITALLLLSVFDQHAAFGIIRAQNFKPGFNFFPRNTDIEEGRKTAAETDKQLPLIEDPVVVNYVTELGLRLARVAPNNYDYPWRFKVVNSSDINAFALPGGFIYVNRATIEAAENEAQLAGVIAHEEGHVVMRHGTHRASEIALAKFPLAIVGGVLGSNQFAQVVTGLGVGSVLLHNSRSAEAQADQVGAYIAYHAGYDPRAMAEFFEMIQKKYPQRTLEFFSDHPNPERRVEKIDTEIPQLGPAREWRPDSPEFHAVKDRLLRMPPAPKPTLSSSAASGAGTTPPAPSLRMRSYQGQGFGIDYPANWQVSGTDDNIVLAPKGGVWSDPQSGSMQAYGASISRSRSVGNDLEADTRQLLSSLQRSNPNLLRVITRDRINVSGHPATRTRFENDSPIQGQKESDELVTLDSGGELLTLVFIAPRSEADAYKPAFEAMLASLSVN